MVCGETLYALFYHLQLKDVSEIPTGMNMIIKHFDGTIAEYV
jgi:hypothetical protein